MRNVDFIIVGQGLAGSILGYKLIQAGKRVLMIDEDKPMTSSKIAIGLTNPITGKRLVKSWLIDEIIPFAKQFYHQIEIAFNISILYETEIARIIPNADIFEQWKSNFQQGIYEGYIHPELSKIQTPIGEQSYFRILQAFYVDTMPLLQAFKDFFILHNAYKSYAVDYSTLYSQDNIRVQDVSARSIIFCDGANGVTNPLTKHLPFNVNKGEVVDVAFENYDFASVLKKNIFITSFNEYNKVGSTYDREYSHVTITEQAKQYFETKLKELVSSNFEITKQYAAIRPATIDRRPFIGHLDHNKYIFNGFGAKGVSLIPYFADQMVRHLLQNRPIHAEASIERFQ